MGAKNNTRLLKMEYNAASRFHDSMAQFPEYEDYLDSKVTPVDLVYLKVSNFRFEPSRSVSHYRISL